MSHVINEWHAYKIDGSNAELTILGEGFGSESGSVKIIVKGAGNSYPQIKKWCDTVIVTEVPVDSEVMVVFVDIPDSKGKKDRARTAPSESRLSTGPTPSFNIDAVIPSPENLTLIGTDLDLVDQVVLYDLDAPPLTTSGDFVEDSGEIQVEWPANFSGDIDKLRAINEPDEVQEVLAPAGGWSPAEPGLVQWAGGSRDASGNILVTITGVGFGAVPGTVSLTDAGGTTQVLVVSWTDSAVVVSASPKTIYTGIELVDDFGVTAEIAPSAPIPFNTPGLEASIVSVTQPLENPEVFRITGSNLDQVASGTLILANNTLEFYSDDPAFYDTDAAANNTAGGTAGVTFGSGQIEVTATDDLSGDIAQTVALKDLNGATNKAQNFPDFLVTGSPGSATSSIFSATDLWVGDGAALDTNGARFFGNGLLAAAAGNMTALDRAGDAQVFTLNTNPSVPNSNSQIAFGPLVPGEKYTNPTVFDDAGDSVPLGAASGDYFVGLEAPPKKADVVVLDSPAQDQLRLQAPGLVNMPYFFINVSTDGTIGGNIGQFRVWYDEMTPHDAGGPSVAASQNALIGVSLAVTPGSPDEWLMTFSAGTSQDLRGLYVARANTSNGSGGAGTQQILDAYFGGDPAIQITP